MLAQIPGRHKYYEHVKSFKLAFSQDGTTWDYYKKNGEDQVGIENARVDSPTLRTVNVRRVPTFKCSERNTEVKQDTAMEFNIIANDFSVKNTLELRQV